MAVREVDLFDLTERINEMGGIDNFYNIIEGYQKALLKIEELEEKIDLYKSLNKALSIKDQLSIL